LDSLVARGNRTGRKEKWRGVRFPSRRHVVQTREGAGVQTSRKAHPNEKGITNA